jgi:hypothetical protein
VRHWPWAEISFWWLLINAAFRIAYVLHRESMTGPEATGFFTALAAGVGVAVWLKLRPLTARWWAVALMSAVALREIYMAAGGTPSAYILAAAFAACVIGLSSSPAPTGKTEARPDTPAPGEPHPAGADLSAGERAAARRLLTRADPLKLLSARDWIGSLKVSGAMDLVMLLLQMLAGIPRYGSLEPWGSIANAILDVALYEAAVTWQTRRQARAARSLAQAMRDIVAARAAHG